MNRKRQLETKSGFFATFPWAHFCRLLFVSKDTSGCPDLCRSSHLLSLSAASVQLDGFPARGSFRSKLASVGVLADPRETGEERRRSTSRCESPAVSSLALQTVCAVLVTVAVQVTSTTWISCPSALLLLWSPSAQRSCSARRAERQGVVCWYVLMLEPTVFAKRMQYFFSSTCELLEWNPGE